MRLTVRGMMSNGKPATEDQLKNVRWTVSDPTIAVVDNGELKPLKSGEITLTANVGGLKTSTNIIIIGPPGLDALIVNPSSVISTPGSLINISIT